MPIALPDRDVGDCSAVERFLFLPFGIHAWFGGVASAFCKDSDHNVVEVNEDQET